jgi:site-specific DNA-methyltransferase (cytosine-N4-specific)
MAWTIHHGDSVETLSRLPSESVDAVVTDPPYAEIDRPYGRLSESSWHGLMDGVVGEVRRILKPHGSAVFILQPNSERVGRMRPWLWEFMAKWSREWNMVQDAWWWNHCTPPTVHCHRNRGLMRPSMKACVWLGPSDCYRNQDEVLITAAEATKNDKRVSRMDLGYSTSGLSMRHGRALAAFRERGGCTPFNVVVCGNSDSSNGSGAHGHGAGTPRPLAEWWTKYLTKPGGTTMDPFCGAGTMGIAAVSGGFDFIGIEKEAEYVATARARVAEAEKLAAEMLF